MSDVDEPFWPPENYYRVALKALIFDDKGRLLVCDDKNNEWAMPGGGWDHGEDYKSGVVREVAEELGATVKEIGPLAFFYRSEAAQGQPKVCLAFPVTLESFDFRFNTEDDEVTGVRFVTKEEFSRLPFQHSESSVKEYADQIWQVIEKKPENR